MNTILIVVIVVAAFIVLWVIGVYNSLIKLRNRTDEAWSDIDVQLKRRFDLIPNLVSTVKGYASHEAATFEKVTKARTEAMAAKGAHDKAAANNVLTDALKSIFALAEAYPELKANQNFLQLQDELSDTENKIQASRRFYNGNVRDFNTKLQMFPTNVIAGMLGFKKYEFFEAGEGERENVKVEF